MGDATELTPEKLQLLLVFVVPGFVALQVYDLFVPGPRRNASDSLAQAITYSMVNLGVMSWAILLLLHYRVADVHPVWNALATLAILLLSPGLLAVATFWLRTSEFLGRWIQHPLATAWDFFFMKRPSCWVIFHLKTGKMVGGKYSSGSYASCSPEDGEVYVEEAWRVDKYGRFTAVAGNRGLLIKRSECEAIEFFDAKGG